MMNSAILRDSLEWFFREDDLQRNYYYTASLPEETVECRLKIKSPMRLVGLPFFAECFRLLGAEQDFTELLSHEGKDIDHTPYEIKFTLPFSVALTGERLALNLLTRASSIATTTRSFVELAKDSHVSILDTRKTTPGLRFLEKYATRMGGGYNHRFGQGDVWMIKDNHKSFFGGVGPALEFFHKMHGYYTPIEVEIHDLAELKEAIGLGVKFFMLDNFSPEQVKAAVDLKPDDANFEVSGGINLESISRYLIPGVDAISIGSLTTFPKKVDLSLKYKRLN